MKLLGRSEKSAPAPTMSETEAEALGKKGRPTPSRKDAQAAAKERARAGMDKKAATKLLREKRTDSNKKMREGMKAGDEKYLPKRDQGPVKRYVRDWVDSRLTFSEFLLPLLVVIMIGSASKNGSPVQRVTSYLWTASILLLLIDTVVLRFRLRKALLAKFPDEDLRGTTFYAYVRTLQIRFMRMPKPKVKFGGSPK